MPVEKIKPELHQMAEDFLARAGKITDDQARTMVADQI